MNENSAHLAQSVNFSNSSALDISISTNKFKRMTIVNLNGEKSNL
ncbi:hypothetical protein VB152_14635 [Xanthomonas fragariae]|nr:hypothetical protein [Xanthomonas fragariae]